MSNKNPNIPTIKLLTKMKPVKYFNLDLFVPDIAKTLVVDQFGNIIWYDCEENKLLFSDQFGWCTKINCISKYGFLGRVDLNGLDWKLSVYDIINNKYSYF